METTVHHRGGGDFPLERQTAHLFCQSLDYSVDISECFIRWRKYFRRIPIFPVETSWFTATGERFSESKHGRNETNIHRRDRRVSHDQIWPSDAILSRQRLPDRVKNVSVGWKESRFCAKLKAGRASEFRMAWQWVAKHGVGWPIKIMRTILVDLLFSTVKNNYRFEKDSSRFVIHTSSLVTHLGLDVCSRISTRASHMHIMGWHDMTLTILRAGLLGTKSEQK